MDSKCEGGIGQNSHKAAGDTRILWIQLLLRKKERLRVCLFFLTTQDVLGRVCSANPVPLSEFLFSAQPGLVDQGDVD